MALLLPYNAVLALLLAAPLAFGQSYLISTLAGGVPIPTPAAADEAAIKPSDVAVDRSGNIYFSSSQCVFKLDRNNVITRIAGTGRRGFSGDGGPALKAQLSDPGPIAIDGNDNVYFIDVWNGRIRRVGNDGVITTFAGTGRIDQSSIDGGAAIDSDLNFPSGLALDPAGNLYIADSGSHRIRKVSSDGIIRTIAGNGQSGNTGDGGPAILASIGVNLHSINGFTMDRSGAIFLSVDNVVRKISADGIITTVAGDGTSGTGGDGGPALKAQFEYPLGLAIDGVGNLYVADFRRVRCVSPDGIVATVAGDGIGGFSGDGDPAVLARIGYVRSIAVGPDGGVLIADQDNNRLREAWPGGDIVTAAGNGRQTFLGDGGRATSAQLNMPLFVAADAYGSVFISDFQDQRIRKVSPDGTITTFAGTGGASIRGGVNDGEPAIQANLGQVAGVVSDKAGNVFVADALNMCVWRIGPDGRIRRFAGSGSQGPVGDGGPALQASFITPWGLALDEAGNLYIADENDERIRKVTPEGTISTVAGNGLAAFSGDDGEAQDASLNRPQSVAVDRTGNVYIADFGNSRVRRVSPSGIITTLAGDGSSGWGGDGGLATAAQTTPQSVALGPDGALYISDGWLIRKISSGQIITTIAGNRSGDNQYSGDCGLAINAFFAAEGLAVGSNGSIYLGDSYNGAVRQLWPVPSANHPCREGSPCAVGSTGNDTGSWMESFRLPVAECVVPPAREHPHSDANGNVSSHPSDGRHQ